MAVGQRSNAQRQTEEAQQQTTAADAQRIGALALVEKRPDLALLLAAEGYRLAALPETRGALMQTLMKYPHLLGVSQPTGDRILRVAAPSDGRVFAVSDDSGHLVLYDGVSLQPLHDPTTLPFIDEVVFSPDGDTVFVTGWTSKDPTGHRMAIQAIDVAGGAVVWKRRIPGDISHPGEAEGVAGENLFGIAPDGRTVTWQVPGVMHRYDVRDGVERADPIPTLPDSQAYILPGDRLLQLTWRHVRVSDLATGRVLRQWKRNFSMISATVISADGRMVGTGGWADGVVATIDLRTGKVREMHGQVQAGWTPDLAFNPDGSMLASVDDAGDVAVWETDSGRQVRDLVGHGPLLRGVAWADGGRTLVTAGMDNTMMAWDLADDRAFVRQGVRPGPQCEEHCAFPHFAFTPDGSRIATLDAPLEPRFDAGWRVRYLDPQTFQQVGALPPSARDCCMAPAFSPDGAQIATVAPLRGTLTLRDASTGEPIRTLFDTDANSISRFPTAFAMDTVAFSPDGSTVATNENADVLLIDPRTGALVARLPTKDYVEFISFSPDGRLIEAASDDGRLTVWDTTTLQQVWQQKIDTDVALGGQFSPDGRLLIAGSFTGRIHVLDASTGEELKRQRILAHAGLVGSLNFSPDGSIFATSGVDGNTFLWDAATGRSLGEPFAVGGNAMNTFSPDGKHAVREHVRHDLRVRRGSGRVDRTRLRDRRSAAHPGRMGSLPAGSAVRRPLLDGYRRRRVVRPVDGLPPNEVARFLLPAVQRVGRLTVRQHQRHDPGGRRRRHALAFRVVHVTSQRRLRHRQQLGDRPHRPVALPQPQDQWPDPLDGHAVLRPGARARVHDAQVMSRQEHIGPAAIAAARYVGHLRALGTPAAPAVAVPIGATAHDARPPCGMWKAPAR